jgi:hypothetical protein
MSAIGEAVLLAQRQHEPPAGAHLFLLAGVVVAALVLFGVSRWRRRRTAAAAEEEPTSHPDSPKNTRSDGNE